MRWLENIRSARVNKIHCRNTSDRNDCEWQQRKGQKGAKKREEDEDRGRILNKIKKLSDAENGVKTNPHNDKIIRNHTCGSCL